MIHFADPQFLLLLLVIPFLIWRHFRGGKRRAATLRYSNTGLLQQAVRPNRVRWRQSLFWLRMAAVALVVVGLARPQSGHTEEEIITEGIDIVLTLDISSSMLAEDFRPLNRLEAAKQVAEKFIRGRRSDRIGLVVFAGKSFTQCPLTLDYGIVINFLQSVKVGLIEDGTAIGLAIANAVNRLRHSEAKSKVVILLTDGRNNRGEIDPITAAKVAKAMGVRIYAIGVGTRGQALYPVNDPIFGKRYVRMPVDIDEGMLRQVARLTNGRYFRATDRESLEKIFEEIDRLEKTKIEVKEYTRYTELFPKWTWAALAVLVLEMVLANTRFRKLP